MTALSQLESLALYGTSRVKESALALMQHRLPQLHIVGIGA